jgi:ornithine cyclodeaminase/alanine dehydrogenase-like protein (mu-crystallin family)
LPDCELVAVVDINQQAAEEVAAKNGAEALTDYQSLLGKVDAVSIVVPTTLHHQPRVIKPIVPSGPTINTAGTAFTPNACARAPSLSLITCVNFMQKNTLLCRIAN